jgi:hypothetical protein
LKISGKIKMSKKANVGKKKSRMVVGLVADSNCFHKKHAGSSSPVRLMG